MRILKFETLLVPNYIESRCLSHIPKKVSIESQDSTDGINKYLLLLANHIGNSIHEIASYLQGPTFVVKDNMVELGTYTVFTRPNSICTGTIVTVKDKYGITLPNLGIFIKKTPNVSNIA